jgi:hypothetical protein
VTLTLQHMCMVVLKNICVEKKGNVVVTFLGHPAHWSFSYNDPRLTNINMGKNRVNIF